MFIGYFYFRIYSAFIWQSLTSKSRYTIHILKDEETYRLMSERALTWHTWKLVYGCGYI